MWSVGGSLESVGKPILGVKVLGPVAKRESLYSKGDTSAVLASTFQTLQMPSVKSPDPTSKGCCRSQSCLQNSGRYWRKSLVSLRLRMHLQPLDLKPNPNWLTLRSSNQRLESKQMLFNMTKKLCPCTRSPIDLDLAVSVYIYLCIQHAYVYIYIYVCVCIDTLVDT